ncbi:hypothetical protein J2S19_004988 [Metabacillus malikii]|uniref:Uncharacterized protein n=1 Tax=Metabacillus malikii TaxID=1504265 RepID=A0ABT9ZMX6_9BACI|nr:hypothetical protein [Metabacillus malikii]
MPKVVQIRINYLIYLQITTLIVEKAAVFK